MKQKPGMFQKTSDAVAYFIYICFVSIFLFAGAIAALWLIWIFLSVIFLGDSSSCPQNLC